MDRHIGARKLIADLVKDEQIEVRRAEIVGRDLAQWCDAKGRAPSGAELEAWLGKHAQVLELYAPAERLEVLIAHHLSSTPPEPVFVEAEHPELEAALHDGPDTPEPYMVYADWLQGQSDVRGELIALGVAATSMVEGGFIAGLNFEEYLAKHEERLFGKLTPKLRQPVELTWKYGVVRAISEIRGQFGDQPPTTAGLWEELLRLRVCRLVQSISFAQPMGIGVEEAVAEHATPTVKHLELRVRQRLPSLLMTRPLRSLSLSGAAIALGPDSLPETLDKLELRLDDITGDGPVELGVRELRLSADPKLARRLVPRLRLPRLERLHLACEGRIDVAKLLEELALPAVKHVTISGRRIKRDDLLKLTRLPFTQQLASLALENVGLSDDALQVLLDSHALPSLRELELGHNELTDAALARARERFEKVIAYSQAPPGTAAGHALRGWAHRVRSTRFLDIDESCWQQVGRDGEIVWGRYRDSADYEVYLSTDTERYGCTCPDRQPCKHVDGLVELALREVREAPAPFEI